MNTIYFWLKNARPTALPQSLLPALLAFCMASRVDGFSSLTGLLAVAGVLMAHLSLNLFDDYFDYKVMKTDFRNRMQHRGMRARISKCACLTSGLTTLKQLLTAACLFGAVALTCGFVIYLYRGYPIGWFAVLAALSGLSYSGPPLRLSYRGLGELLIGLLFGPTVMAGVFYAACGTFERSVLFVSIPVGLFVANIVYTHAILDYEPDRAVGKMTLAVRLKDKKRMLRALFLLLLTAFVSVISGVVSGALSAYCLFSLLTLPMAVGLFRLMIAFVRDPGRRFTPRFWMGPLGDWRRIQALGIDWFMIRWLVARNLLAFFCIILTIVSLMT
jgi:1,4-dihydroxy-2-naphthoate octaprenyltransferase